MTTFYTIQMASHQEATRRNIEVVDITVKSGNCLFAPTWEMVRAWKAGKLSEEDYSRRYSEMMYRSYSKYTTKWLELFGKDGVALACYCRAGSFCHRHLLRDYLSKVARRHNLDFIDGGEIIKG